MKARIPYFLSYRKLVAVIGLVFAITASVQAQTVVMASGDDFTAIIDATGNLYTYGANTSGQLGTGSADGQSSTVALVEPAGQWADVSVSRTGDGTAHVLAIQTDGSLWAWGSNTRGQLGIGTEVDSNVPVLVDNTQTWVEVAAGKDFSIGRVADGRVFVWGDNSAGQLARTIFENPLIDIQRFPVLFDSGTTYISISAGLQVGLGVRTDGSLYAWGSTNTLQLGQPAGSPHGALVGPAIVPQRIGLSNAWTRVVAGSAICFGFQDGSLFVWGGGGNTGVGYGPYTPVQVGSDIDWASISIGDDHTLALKTDGRLFGWGDNGQGELGLPHQDESGMYIGANFYKLFPTHLETASLFLAAGAGKNFSSIYTTGEFLLSAGSNDVGQLGDGLTSTGVQDFFDSSTLGLADLAAISVTVTTVDPVPGSPMNATVVLQNLGTGTITTDFDLGARLSTTGLFDGLGSIVLPFSSGGTVTTDLGPGAVIAVGVTLSLPANIPQGEYRLVVRADSATVLDEVTVANNDVATVDTDPVEEGDDGLLSFIPDLTIISTDIIVSPLDMNGAPSAFPLSAGDRVEVQVTVQNIGTGGIPAGVSSDFALRYVLAEVSDINDSSVIDLVLDDTSTPTVDEGVPVSGSVVKTFEFALPDSLGVGDFFLGVAADSNTEVTEINEDNNVAFTTTPLVGLLGIDLAEALDNFALDFETVGDGVWFGSDNPGLIGTAVDGDAAVSPPISVGQSAQIRTTVEEPSLLSFRWRTNTTSSSNTLSFSLIGAETGPGENVISGDRDWALVERVVPAGVQIVWTYTEGVDSASDTVFLDDIQIAPITGPDFVVDSASLTSAGQPVASGRYVLGADRLDLSIQVRNQGLDHLASDPDINVRVYLSRDGIFSPPDGGPVGPSTDILVHTIPLTGALNSGQTSVLFPSIELPTTITSENYRLIVVVDEDNAVTEIAELPFPDQTGATVQLNNALIGATANIEIAALPDLIVSSVSPEPGFFLVGADIDFDLTIENTGLSAVGSTPIRIRIVLSQDNNLDAEDYAFGAFDYTGGLAEAGALGSTNTFSPDIGDVRSDVPVGEFRYFGVIIDSEDAQEELNEGNNTAFYPNPYFVFAHVPLDVAVELDDLGVAAVTNRDSPFTGAKPFVGQIDESFDLVDAAQSTLIDDGETAAFEATIEPTTPTVLSFNWKVSSERVVISETNIKEDTLNVYVDDILRASISGEKDWSEVRIAVSAGSHKVRWTYEKDISDAEGQDRGWVDNIQYKLPDLTVTDLTVATDSLTPGDMLDFTFKVTNAGEDPVPATPTYTMEVRLSPDPVWGNTGDVVLVVNPELRSTEALASGAAETFNVSVSIPPTFADVGTYFVGVRVDPDIAASDEPLNGPGVVPESNESNNTTFTATALLTITPPITLDEAIDDGDPGDTDGVDLLLTTGGSATWFGLDGRVASELPSSTTVDANTDDIAQSGPIDANEETYFESSIVGPKVVKFRWKSDSAKNANFLEFSLNNVVQERISGHVDWDFGYGPFTLSFEGEVTAAIPSDAEAIEVQDALNALPSITAAGGVTVGSSVTDGVFSYTIAFNVVGNRSLVSFLALDGPRVSSATISTTTAGGINGSTTQEEIQILTLVPNVYFTLSYRGETTAEISYLATAADVATELNLLSTITADGGVTVADHPEAESALDFLVSFVAAGERELITVNPAGLKQPVTVEADLLSDRFKPSGSVGVQGDSVTMQIQPLRIGPEITVFIPSGSGAQTVRWSYRKTGTAGDHVDAGWVDQIRVLDFAEPELVLTTIDYVAGTYVLDVTAIAGAPSQKLGTETLDISVIAQNQGTDLPPGAGAFTSADLEVRLSEDRVYGNADDIVLGTFAQTEGGLEGGDIMSFIGGLPLGDNIPENSYYLIAKVDANERIDEFSTANNIFITANRDVFIERRARLRPFDLSSTDVLGGGAAFYADVIEFDETRIYYPDAPMHFPVDIQNVGLDNLFDENGQVINWSSRLELVAIQRSQLDVFAGSLGDFETAVQATSIVLGHFSVAQAMEGRRDGMPDGDIVELDIELKLPNTLQILSMLEDGETMEQYAFFLRLIIDEDDDVLESGAVNTWNIVNLVSFLQPSATTPPDEIDDGFFSITTLVPTTQAAWDALYGGGPFADGDGLIDDLEYAFVRDPLVSDSFGSFPGTYGFETVNAQEYLAVTFDFLVFDDTIDYVVEAADSLLGPWTPLVTIDGAYLADVGSQSLNGDGGLLAEPQVISVVDQGYSARVTVIDTEPVSASATRFMRIVVDGLAVDTP